MYKGHFHYSGNKKGKRGQVTIIKDAMEPVISAEQWDRVNSWIHERSGMASKRACSFRSYLRGKVFCSCCNSAMSPSGPGGKKSNFRYYRCTMSTKMLTKCEPSHLNAERLHEALVADMAKEAREGNLEAILEYIPDDTAVDKSMLADSQSALEGKIRGKQAAIANLIDFICKGRGTESTSEALKTAEAELNQAKEDLAKVNADLVAQRNITPDVSKVEEAWARLGEVWGVLSDDERQEFFNETVERIEVHPDGKLKATLRIEFPANERSKQIVGYDTEEAPLNEPLGSRFQEDWYPGRDSNP